MFRPTITIDVRITRVKYSLTTAWTLGWKNGKCPTEGLLLYRVVENNTVVYRITEPCVGAKKKALLSVWLC